MIMRSFVEIFSWAEDNPSYEQVRHRTILFEMPGWWLYILDGTDLYFAHGCPTSHGGDKWNKSHKCASCDEAPSDDFITVATLMHEPRRRSNAHRVR